MHDQQVIDRFITLRAQGWTFSRLMSELNVSKPTLINWSRKYRFLIQNSRAIELEALREKWLGSSAARVKALGEQLRRVEVELAGRDVAGLSTPRLFSVAEGLRRQIDREIGPMQFTTPVAEIPHEDRLEEVQDWAP